jgi:hypothetical protein
MTDEEIFDMADDYGWQDDFGRWDFYPEGLVNFALALMGKEREACAKTVESLAEAIRARGEA